MSTDKLVIEETLNGFHIVWYSPEDGSGAIVGEYNQVIGTKPVASDLNDDVWDFLLAEYIARQCAETPIGTAIVWESLAKATMVRRLINAEIKAAKAAFKAAESGKADKPMPHWALMALDHGWKAPKGWKP